MQKLLFFLLFAAFSTTAFSKKSGEGDPVFQIKAKIANYTTDTLVLGYHQADKQYIKDTAFRQPDGWFVFESEKAVEPGVYLLVMRPGNQFVQVLVGPKEQHISMEFNGFDVVPSMKIKGSRDNEAFYEYLNYLGKERVEADTIRAQMSRAKLAGRDADSIALAKKIDKITEAVLEYQNKFVAKNAGPVSTMIVKGAMEVKIPEFDGADQVEKDRKRYYWYKQHYFDNFDLADPAALRSPLIHQRMTYFVDKMTPQHPDSIIQSIEFLLAKCKPAEETHKFYLIHFLNFYAKSNIVGMDAVYVHLAKKYYCSGLTTWAKKEDIEKICDNAKRLEPILIGKIAPNIQLEKRDGTKFSLYDVDADYTVLYFWAWDCGHCKKGSPFMIDFAKKWNPKGVKTFAVCTALYDKLPECWKAIDEREYNDLFINVVDPYLKSNYKNLYDVRSTPQIFILDRKHEIIMKRIGAEQVDEVMEEIIKMEDEKRKAKGK